MSHGLTRILKPATAGAALLVLGGGAAVLTQSSETLLRSSFARALQPANAPVVADAPLDTRHAGLPISGSEEFWLTAMGRDVAMSKGVSLGDRITFTLDGKERNYRVTAVSEIKPATTRVDTRAFNTRVVLVTARDTSADPGARSIRFIIEIPGAPSSVVAGRGARAL